MLSVAGYLLSVLLLTDNGQLITVNLFPGSKNRAILYFMHIFFEVFDEKSRSESEKAFDW